MIRAAVISLEVIAVIVAGLVVYFAATSSGPLLLLACFTFGYVIASAAKQIREWLRA